MQPANVGDRGIETTQADNKRTAAQACYLGRKRRCDLPATVERWHKRRKASCDLSTSGEQGQKPATRERM